MPAETTKIETKFRFAREYKLTSGEVSLALAGDNDARVPARGGQFLFSSSDPCERECGVRGKQKSEWFSDGLVVEAVFSQTHERGVLLHQQDKLCASVGIR
jgi:hypothetical protein